MPRSPDGIAVCQSMERRGRQMKDTMIGVDLAKNVFVLHGASMTGELKFRKKLWRRQFLGFMESQPAAVIVLIVLEAYGSAHYWARELAIYGHEVKLIAPQYVRPCVKEWRGEHYFTSRQMAIMRKNARRSP